LNNERNALMLQLSTAVLSSSNIRPSINITSSSGDVLDDDERDEIALFVQQQSEKFKNKNSNNNNNSDHHHHHHQLHDENENPIEILPSTSLNSKDKIEQNCKSKTNNRSSQTENHLPCHYPAKRMKTRLKEETNSDGTSITASNITDNTGKIAKRKAYSRMKKERKATQTLIIVLICFLVCWLPFFVLNNLVNAIFKLSSKSNILPVNDFILSFCVWLGYINSFLNPIIYTIFNLEFRKAFAKILFSSCRSSNINPS